MRNLLSMLILLFHFSVTGQKSEVILCDLNIEIIPGSSITDTNVFCMYNNTCEITQSFQISNYQKDTMCLTLDHPSQFAFLNPIYFQKLIVKEKNEGKTIPHVFESNRLKFPIPKKSCVIEINYYYQPDYFYLGNSNMTCVFCPYQSSWFSWHFTAPNMKISSMVAEIPNHLYFFSNLKQKIEKGKIYLSCDSIPNEGISFFWIEKRYYEQVTTNIQENQYNLYFLKNITLSGDSSSCDAAMLPSERVDETRINARISGLKKDVRSIEKIFQKKVDVDIVEACLDLSLEGNMIRWGSAFSLSENQVFIVMDTSFWNEHFCIHEIVHAYNDILPFKNDSAYYFFHESMTEFLAVYSRYNRQTTRDSIYEAKILKYISLKQDYTTIFEIDKIATDLEYGGTYGVAYLKTPFVINCFAKKIGEERFIEILTFFYKQVRKTGIVNFQEFEKVFKSNGVSNEDWGWFVKNL